MGNEPNIPHIISTGIIGLISGGMYVQFGEAIATKQTDPEGWLILAFMLSILSVFNFREIFKS